ncbi:MAG: Cys-tRNA(Pro) deacylase [Actinomycetia bacterium]|nr:Cys-tRNA(Pro) deacylase [Actinomycetes bacterium]MCP4959738.1 Cys-tRNA(Pro) deacylase [Actinomycetes bacterium]
MTPAVAQLIAAGVPHELFPYDHDPAVESFGLEAAAALGVDPDSVFKTLIADAAGVGLVVGIVAVSAMLDLKALARVSGAKKATMADISAAERSSGYVAGGISPFGHKRQLPTFVDETCDLWDHIYVSAGRRGLDLAIAPADLVEVVQATRAPIAVW